MASGRAAARGSSSGSNTNKRVHALEQPAASQPVAPTELQVIQNPHHFSQNVGVVYFLRIYMTIVAGSAVGILGAEGWSGLILYFISQLLCSLPILTKCGGDVKKHLGTWDKALLEHVFSSTAILSYILFWMIFYNVCHVF